VRDLQRGLPLPASGLKPGHCGAKVGHPVHQDRAFPLDVVGQDHQRRAGGELDGSDPGPHRLDGEDNPPAQDLGEVLKVGGYVVAGRVHEVQLLEGYGLVNHGRSGR
jgi:hypothetical protein